MDRCGLCLHLLTTWWTVRLAHRPSPRFASARGSKGPVPAQDLQGEKKSGMKAKCYYYTRPRDQSSRVSTHVDSLTARLTEEEKVAAKLTQEGSSVPPLLFRRRGNAPAAGELLSCPAAARRSSPLQLPERDWAHRGLRQRGSSRQRPGAVQRAWRLRSRCHPHQPRHLQVQRALEGPLLRLCGVPFVWVRCRPR